MQYEMPADAPQEMEVEKKPSTPNSDRPRSFFARNSASDVIGGEPAATIEEYEEKEILPAKWSMGILNDPTTHEVPGKLFLEHPRSDRT